MTLNVKDSDGVIHKVKEKESDREFGRTACNDLFYEVHMPVQSRGARVPVNPTKEDVTCLFCLATS